MRSFADTLPTLRESGASQPAPPAVKEAPRFNPLLLQKAATAMGHSRGAAPAPEAPGEPDVAEIRRELLRRQNLNDDAAPAEHAGRSEADAAANSPSAPVSPLRAASGAHGGTVSTEPKPAASVVPPIVSAGGGPSKVSVQDQIAEAVAEAKREAEIEKAAAVEFARKVERDVAARAVAEERESWRREEGEAFAERCTEGFEALHRKLSDAFGRALAPIAEAAIREAAVRRFAAVLDDLIGASAGAPSLTVRGPGPLLKALEQASGENGVAFEETEGAMELSVTVDETTLRTTIHAWSDTIAKTLGGDDVE